VTGSGNVVTGSVRPVPGSNGSTRILRLVTGDNRLRLPGSIAIGQTVPPGKVDHFIDPNVGLFFDLAGEGNEFIDPNADL
jgi:hypothetical protein